MTNFSQEFSLPNGQADLDFIDIDLHSDTPLYLDPYAIQIRHDTWSEKCGDYIRSFFNCLLDELRNGNSMRADELLSNLHEPNETFLGESKGIPQGRAVGAHKAKTLAESLIKSRAFKTGLLTDISEAELFIEGIGPDTISDLTTNIIRGLLAEYSKEQCNLYNIPTQTVHNIGPIWNPASGNWEAIPLVLPVYKNKPVLLIPKYSVRFHLALNSQEFWNFHMIDFLRKEYLSSGSGIVKTFKKSKEKYVTKKDVKKIHPFIKDDLADFVSKHPNILDIYKNLKGAKGPLSTKDIQENFNEGLFAAALIKQLGQIPEGNPTASQYHSFAMGICTFLFYPNLIYPVKENEIHQGRKRVDIKYTNAAETGFFKRVLEANQTRSIVVPIECKNYQKEVSNPELDQLAGRFGHQRGFFGILLCRRVDDRQKLIQRCRDTASDNRGVIIVLADADLEAMLKKIENNRRDDIDKFLQERLDEIIQ